MHVERGVPSLGRRHDGLDAAGGESGALLLVVPTCEVGRLGEVGIDEELGDFVAGLIAGADGYVEQTLCKENLLFYLCVGE